MKISVIGTGSMWSLLLALVLPKWATVLFVWKSIPENYEKLLFCSLPSFKPSAVGATRTATSCQIDFQKSV